jgi:hypothetical protein
MIGRALVVLLLFACPASAAPKVDYLFPAGGQCGASVEVEFSGTFPIWPAEGWASHPGIVITPAKQSGKATIAIAPDVPGGVHWLRLFDKTGASGLRPFLVSQVVEVQEKEPNDDYRKPQSVLQPVVVNGRLGKPDDVDNFAVVLKKGETLVASVEAFRTLRSPMDAVLQVLSADGFVLAQNDDFLETDPLIAFVVPKDGTYLVRVFCFPATPDSRVAFFGKETCVYRLTLTTGPYLDHTLPAAVERNKGGEIELSGWNIPADGRRLSIPAGEKADRVFVQPPGFAGGAWVRIEPHAVVRAGEAPAAPVSIGGRVQKPGGRDSSTFSAKKGERLSIRLEARDVFLALDPFVTIRDAAGKSLQTAQAAKLGGDPAFEFTAPTEGPLTLEVRDAFDGGGPRYSYLARIRPVAPEFDASVTLDHFTGTAGQPIDVPIAVTLRNGLKGPIAFRLEGLPETARAEYVSGGGDTTPAPTKKGKKNEKKALSATAAVRIHGITEPIHAPFRLYAFATGQEETIREVPAALTDLNAAVPYLWLTQTKSAKGQD